MNHSDIASVLFEYPLNQKMRIWLRLEFLLQQLYSYTILNTITNTLAFFNILINLLDLLERSDIRSEMLKELDRQQHKLLQWQGVSGVDSNRINELCIELKNCVTTLIAAHRLGQSLRDDRLIVAVRQRISIPGGCCGFDLPTLHIWLHLPQFKRDIQVRSWLKELEPLNVTLTKILNLVRDYGLFKTQVILNGFFQNNIEDGDLLRMRIPIEYEIYPQVSGHKTRYAIRFLSLNGKDGIVPDNFTFELACC